MIYVDSFAEMQGNLARYEIKNNMNNLCVYMMIVVVIAGMTFHKKLT